MTTLCPHGVEPPVVCMSCVIVRTVTEALRKGTAPELMLEIRRIAKAETIKVPRR